MHDCSGRTVIVTGGAGALGHGAGMTAYAISKAGVAARTVAMAQETAGDGILVNAVAPSTMDTPANRKAMPKADHAAWPSVDDVAATILFLASADNTVTRGAVVPVYGKSESAPLRSQKVAGFGIQYAHRAV